MSLPKKSFFRLSLILPLVILLIFVFMMQKQGETGVQEESGEKAKLAKYEKGFGDHLGDLFSQLRKYFEAAKFEEMADLLVDRTVLYTPSGEKKTTKGELLNFFRGVHQPDVIDLKFKVAWSKVFLVAEPKEVADPIDAIGHAIITYHLIKEKGKTTTNTMGPMGYGAPHPSSCPWGKPPEV